MIAKNEELLGCRLPIEYAMFLAQFNGGDGFVGKTYLRLSRVEELASDNAGYEVKNYVPGFLLIGSDGGGEAFGFDTREREWPVVKVPFIPMNWRYAIRVGASFDEFLVRLHEE